MYVRRAEIGGFITTFSSTDDYIYPSYYWSSTKSGSYYYDVGFHNGDITYVSYSHRQSVRPIRVEE